MTTEPALPAAPALNRARQLEAYRRASKVLPGGANSNFRSWGEDTVYVDRGQGGLVYDIDGNPITPPPPKKRKTTPRGPKRGV